MQRSLSGNHCWVFMIEFWDTDLPILWDGEDISVIGCEFETDDLRAMDIDCSNDIEVIRLKRSSVIDYLGPPTNIDETVHHSNKENVDFFVELHAGNRWLNFIDFFHFFRIKADTWVNLSNRNDIPFMINHKDFIIRWCFFDFILSIWCLHL